MQFEKDCRRYEPAYLYALWFEKIEQSDPIPKEMKKVLREFEDIHPNKLPKGLPPRIGVDHEIELVPEAKPPTRAPYRMMQPELV